MTDQEQRIAIAEACGIEVLISTAASGKMGRKKGWGDGDWKMLPDYLNDLNAMHEAENTLDATIKASDYSLELKFVILSAAGLNPRGLVGSFRLLHAAARQRAEAFLRTIGKWNDVP